MMVTLAHSIQDRYDDDDTSLDTGSGSGIVFIVSVSSSPQSRAGKLPRVLTIIDYNIESMGDLDTNKYPTQHIQEIDLSDNLISDWSQLDSILSTFPSLVFLNLARNLLSSPLISTDLGTHSNLSKLILNGNKVSWSTVSTLLTKLPHLTELRLSHNGLTDPHHPLVTHQRLEELWLSCNHITSLASILTHVEQHCTK